MVDAVLGDIVKDNDLGVTLSADMKVSEQCGIAASKCNQIIGLTERMWLRVDQIDIYKVWNGHKNIDSNMFSHSRKVIELGDTSKISPYQ